MRRSGIKIMTKLIGLVKPLMHVMAAAVLLGVAGHLTAIFLMLFGGYAILSVLGLAAFAPVKTLFLLMAACAVLRGIFRYAEQACNHYIAFKLLALIRHKVFAVMRKLAPAKLEGKDKGNLIAILTSDIELLEVFYAHTISPVLIAVLTSGIMVFYMGRNHLLQGVIALAGYLFIGVCIPLYSSRHLREDGMKYRNGFGELNSYFLDSLRGLKESIQYSDGPGRLEEIERQSGRLDEQQKSMKGTEGVIRAVTELSILVFSLLMFFVSLKLFQSGTTDFAGVVLPSLAMFSSFGPVVALSSLSNNLTQTLASGERVLAIMEEEPQTEEITNGLDVSFTGAACEDISFAYEKEKVLENYSLGISPGKITGIFGKSGSGKSTVLKLFMRFWDPDSGKVTVSGNNVKQINTASLRNAESYLTQETCLFHGSIADNIGIAKENASEEEIVEAARKASVHEFIETLPNGYDTNVGELGDSLSGGEKQRIGLARAFLHGAPFLLLDEPTSNLDSLNEGIILKSLKEWAADRTVILVSHRESTLRVADEVYEISNVCR